MNPVIVVLAYRRPQALQRLLDSLAAATYPAEVSLVISLEGDSSGEVVNLARSFTPEGMNVQVLQRERRLGLRDHVIACADLSEDYGSVIILEDDLIVDPYFYLYASQALDFYRHSDSVAGIALYGYEYNEFANLPFTPMSNGFSTYPMQLACSWGQCWTREQWSAFKAWYSGTSQAHLNKIDRLPPAVKSWPESSWKKYFHGFMIETGKYFMYPYQSYSTNCSDTGGEHIQDGTSIHQVSLGLPDRDFAPLRFKPMCNNDVLYDSFMEPVGAFVYRSIGYDRNQVEIDLQGTKPIELLRTKKLAITTKPSHKPIKSYEQQFRPIEMNLRRPGSGHGDPTWTLVNTEDILANRKTKPQIEWFNYFAGMNLKSSSMYIASFAQLPSLVLRKISRAIR